MCLDDDNILSQHKILLCLDYCHLASILYVQIDNQMLLFDILQTCVYFTIISNI